MFPWTGVIPGDPKLYYVQVHNASDRPVYDVGVTLHYRQGTDSGTQRFQSEPVTALMPRQTTRIPAKQSIRLAAAADPDAVWSTAWFRDANEVRWTVTSQGEINEAHGIPLFTSSSA